MDCAPSPRTPPGGPARDHLGIAGGGTGIGYGAAAVHSYRLQAKQRGGNTMKEKKNKKHKGMGQDRAGQTKDNQMHNI